MLSPGEWEKLGIVREQVSDFGREVKPWFPKYDVAICVGVVVVIALLGYFALTNGSLAR